MNTKILQLAPFITAALVAVFAPAATHAQTENAAHANVWGDYLAGHHAEATGDSRKALELYRAATAKGMPATADLYSRMYILGLTEGRIDSALDALDKAEQMGAKSPLSSLTRAVRALRDGDYDGAEALLAGDNNGISRILSPALTAWARVGRKDIAGALDILSKSSDEPATKDNKPAPLHLLHGALINEMAGKVKSADTLFARLHANTTLSVRTAQLSGQYFERRGLIKNARKIYTALGPDAESRMLIEAMEKRMKANTRPALDVDTPQKGASEALYGVASVLLSQNAMEAALALSHLADALRPGFAPATVVAAAALQQDRRYADANALYDGVAKTSPFSWLARLHLASNLNRMDQTDKAIGLLRAMGRERPKLARPLIELGDVLRGHERFKEAAVAYSDALARIPEPTVRHWRVFYSRGIAYEQSKRWAKAEADFLFALKLSPEQPLVLNYLGYSWVDQGLHLERALKMIATAVEKRPRDGYIVDSLGWGLYRTGDFAGAVKNLERAVMLTPADPVINDHLGDALWQVGRVREARFQWERALALDPDEKLTLAIEKKLKSGLATIKP